MEAAWLLRVPLAMAAPLHTQLELHSLNYCHGAGPVEAMELPSQFPGGPVAASQVLAQVHSSTGRGAQMGRARLHQTGCDDDASADSMGESGRPGQLVPPSPPNTPRIAHSPAARWQASKKHNQCVQWEVPTGKIYIHQRPTHTFSPSHPALTANPPFSPPHMTSTNESRSHQERHPMYYTCPTPQLCGTPLLAAAYRSSPGGTVLGSTMGSGGLFPPLSRPLAGPEGRAPSISPLWLSVV